MRRRFKGQSRTQQEYTEHLIVTAADGSQAALTRTWRGDQTVEAAGQGLLGARDAFKIVREASHQPPSVLPPEPARGETLHAFLDMVERRALRAPLALPDDIPRFTPRLPTRES